MSKTNIFSLSNYGFADQYVINKQGIVIDTQSNKIIQPNRSNIINLLDSEGNYISISTKNLYRKVFNEEYCIDIIENIPGEEWKVIPNTNEKYFISNCGRVKSKCAYTARILKAFLNSNCYYRVNILGKMYFIHKLVAEAFVINNNPAVNNVIHHLDGVKTNNFYLNLTYTTQSENLKEYYKSIKRD